MQADRPDQGCSSVGTETQGDRLQAEQLDTVRSVQEGNVLFNDALKTFYLRLYVVTHRVKDHSDSERERKHDAATWATLSD